MWGAHCWRGVGFETPKLWTQRKCSPRPFDRHVLSTVDRRRSLLSHSPSTSVYSAIGVKQRVARVTLRQAAGTSINVLGGGVNVGHVTMTTHFSGIACHCRLERAMINLSSKFEVSISTKTLLHTKLYSPIMVQQKIQQY